MYFPPYNPGQRIQRIQNFQRFTGSVDDLYNLVYSIENEIRVLEGTGNKTDAQWRRLNSLYPELAYLKSQQAKPENAYTVSFGECGVGHTNPNTITFPDYADSLVLDEAGQKEKAIARFKINVKNLFERFLYATFQGKEGTTSRYLTAQDYQFHWNWFQQENDTINPDPTKIVYRVRTMDSEYGIPSNPEAYSPNETGVMPEEADTTGELGAVVREINPTINPYVDPNVYVYTGEVSDADLVVQWHKEHEGGIIPPHISELYPDIVSPVIYDENETPDCKALFGTEGLFYDTTRGACRCPDGQHVDSVAKKCVPDSVPKTCETGYHLENGLCVKDVSLPSGSDNTIDLMGLKIKPIYLIGGIAALVLVLIIRKL